MIKFLAKGLIRDKTRSLFPTIIITTTVAIVIFALGFMRGMLNSVFLDTAVIIAGYQKVVTKAYKEEIQMLPLDLALLDIEEMIFDLKIFILFSSVLIFVQVPGVGLNALIFLLIILAG